VAGLRRGYLEDGITACRQALEIDPCRFDARVNLIRALAAVEKTAEARVAGLVPENCHLLPEQTRRIADERDSLR